MDRRRTQVEPEVDTGARPSEPTPGKRVQRRVAIASFSGTLIEFYDFQVYAIAAALVFPHVLFPALGTAAGTVASIATFGVAFVVRPFGSVIFGHFGDRFGRKNCLVLSLLLMGGSTVLVGLMPTANQIGIAAPILVTFLRVMQGLAAGGEWAGAALLAGEYSPPGKRGLWTMFPQLGANSAIGLVNGTFLLTGLWMGGDTFLTWGWRVPFLASAVLLVIGLVVRLKIDETPVFKRQASTRGATGVPLGEAFRKQPSEILLAAGAVLSNFVLFYVWNVFLTNYATTTLHFERPAVLLVGLIGGLIMPVVTVVAGPLSDRIGRRTVIGAANIAGIVWSLVLFPVLGLHSTAAFVIMVCTVAVILGAIYGPMGAFIPELFHTRYRFSASAVAYALSSVVGGAIVPLLAPVITGAFGAFSLGITMALLCLIAAMCTFRLSETRSSDLEKAGTR